MKLLTNKKGLTLRFFRKLILGEKSIMGISVLIDEFTEDMKLKHYSERTITSYYESLRNFASFLDERNISDIRDVGLNDLNNYKKSLLESGKKYSSHTVYLRLRTAKRFFEYLEKTNHLLINPAENFLIPKLGKRLPRNILSKEEITTLFKMPDTTLKTGIRDRAIMELLYSCAIRLSECINLQVYNVDTTDGYLRINNGKGNKDRILPLGKKACKWLKKYLCVARPYFLRKNTTDGDNLWMNQEGRKIASIWLNRLLNKYAQKAGIKKRVTVHTFRRTFATHLLQSGANPYYIQQLLGHEDGSTISKYIKLVPVDVKKAHRKHHPRG